MNIDPHSPLDGPAAARRLRHIIGRGDAHERAIVDAVGRVPAAIDWAGQRLRWSTAAAVLDAIDALGRAEVEVDGPLDGAGAALWVELDDGERSAWCAAALMGSTATLACVEAAGGSAEALSALAERSVIGVDDGLDPPRVVCGPAWARAVFSVAGADRIAATARAIAGPLERALAAAGRGWFGPDGATCAATLRAHIGCVGRLAPMLDDARAARLMLHVAPALHDHPDGGALLEAAWRRARRGADRSLVGAAVAALARRACQRGGFAEAGRWLDTLDADHPDDWRLALDRAHLALRTGRFDVAEAALARAAAAATDPVEALQVEVQRALGLHLRGEGEAARARLEALIAEADARGAPWVAGVARWHLGASAVDGPDPLAGVATLTRAVGVAEAFGVHVARSSSRAFVARGLRRAGLLQAAADEARRGWDGARAEGLDEAEFDCAIERLELLLAAGGGDPVEARLWVLEVAAGGRRPAARRRAEAALTRAPGRGPRVDVEGRWIDDPDGRRVDLSRRVAARRVLARLVAERRQRSGRAVSVEALFQSGWPDTVIRPESRARRVYTAVWQLRDMGLGPGLESADGGYRLGERVVVAAPTDAATGDGRQAAGS